MMMNVCDRKVRGVSLLINGHPFLSRIRFLSQLLCDGGDTFKLGIATSLPPLNLEFIVAGVKNVFVLFSNCLLSSNDNNTIFVTRQDRIWKLRAALIDFSFFRLICSYICGIVI